MILNNDIKSLEEYRINLFKYFNTVDKTVNNTYSLFKTKLDNYISIINKNSSARYAMSKDYINVAELAKSTEDSIQLSFQMLSEKYRVILDKVLSSSLDSDIIYEFRVSISGLLDAIASYIKNFIDNIAIDIQEYNSTCESPNVKDYNSKEYSVEDTDDIVEFDGKVVVYTERDAIGLMKLLDYRGYKNLYSTMNCCLLFKDNSVVTMPLSTPPCKELQCYILGEIDL